MGRKGGREGGGREGGGREEGGRREGGRREGRDYTRVSITIMYNVP